MRRSVLFLVAGPAVSVLVLNFGMNAPNADDTKAVERAVPDYCQAFYEMKPELLEGVLHPELQKFGFHRGSADQEYRRVPSTYSQLLMSAGVWNLDGKFGADAPRKVEVYEVLDKTAAATLTGGWGIDYLHPTKDDGNWKIVQVLWQSHPQSDVRAEDSLSQKVDALFARWDTPDSPGAALAVVRNGEIIYKRGYGLANLEYGVPITPSTIFHTGSVSKQFTAFAIALLVDRGKIALEDDIRRHLAEVPEYGKTITIRHLIHHSSGLRNWPEALVVAGWQLDDVITQADVLDFVANQKELNFPPGERIMYCNTGYTLLAEIVARATGTPFREWTRANIFEPLGMTSTHFHDDHEMIVPNRAYSYAPVGEGFRKQVLNYSNVGPTGLFTTVEDLAKWVDNFANGRVGGAGVLDLMSRRGVLNDGEVTDYAFGQGLTEYRGFRVAVHSGSDAGFRSYLLRVPEQRLAVVVLSNVKSLDASALGKQVADLYLPDQLGVADYGRETKVSSAKPKAIELEPTAYEVYSGAYKVPSGPLLTVTTEGDHLVCDTTLQRWVLCPLSETRFFITGDDSEISFEKDDQGNVKQLTLHAGQDIVAERIRAHGFSVAQLTEFAGDYRSDELDTTYTVVVRDNQLVATHRHNPDILLHWTGRETFAGNKWWMERLEFTRNGGNNIDGFRVTVGGARNLRFDKRHGNGRD